jgi:hypothetical protein
MRTLGFPLSSCCALLLLLAAGCASFDRPKPISGPELVELARSGKSAPEIIAELKRTDTILALQATDIVNLHEAGVPNEVLDYLQRAQIDEIRWRDYYSQGWWYGPGYYRGYGYGPCPFPTRRGYRGGAWGC